MQESRVFDNTPSEWEYMIEDDGCTLVLHADGEKIPAQHFRVQAIVCPETKHFIPRGRGTCVSREGMSLAGRELTIDHLGDRYPAALQSEPFLEPHGGPRLYSFQVLPRNTAR